MSGSVVYYAHPLSLAHATWRTIEIHTRDKWWMIKLQKKKKKRSLVGQLPLELVLFQQKLRAESDEQCKIIRIRENWSPDSESNVALLGVGAVECARERVSSIHRKYYATYISCITHTHTRCLGETRKNFLRLYSRNALILTSINQLCLGWLVSPDALMCDRICTPKRRWERNSSARVVSCPSARLLYTYTMPLRRSILMPCPDILITLIICRYIFISTLLLIPVCLYI